MWIRWIALIGAACMALTVACKKTPDIPPDDFVIRGIAEQAEVMDDNTVVVLSTGYGVNDERAALDAYRAGVWFVAQSLALTQVERMNLEAYRMDFIAEPLPYIKDVRVLGGGPDGAWIRASQRLVINKGQIRQELEHRGVLKTTDELLEEADYPQVMIISEDPSAPFAREARNEAASFLRSRGFEVLDAEGSQVLQGMRAQLEGLSFLQDEAAMIAMTTGADIYFVVDAKVQNMGGSKQGAATIKAYETTTARLLAADNSVSHNRAAGSAADSYLASEAARDGIAKVMDGILIEWKAYLTKGKAYYIVLQGDFSDGPFKRSIKGALAEAVGDRTTLKVETTQTMEFTARSSKDLSELGDALEIKLESMGVGYTWTLKNRQMLLLNVQ